jgi:hypothetical protein
MSNPLVLNCPKCSAEIVTSFDRDNDSESVCPLCKAAIVVPRNGGKPFVTAGMIFAHWTNTPANPGLEDAEQFLVKIPEGKSRTDAIEKLLANGVSVAETDGLEFQEKWPKAIRRQFDSLDADSEIRWSWASLK